MMTTITSGPTSSSPAEGALQVLELFASAAHIAFDRAFAARALKEAEQSISGDDALAWSRRLVEVGESLNLRVRYVECTFDEALAFAQQEIPVAFCEATNVGVLQWTVLQETKRGKIRVAKLHHVEIERWKKRKKLRAELGLAGPDARGRFVIGQVALACQADGRPAHHRSGEKTLAPLARLIGLVRPEKKDLWAIIIFSLVVGVLALATPIAVEALVNTVAFGQYLQPVVVLALLLFTFLAFAAGLRALIAFVVEIFQRRLFIRVIEDLAYRLPRAKMEEFDRQNGTELVNRFFDVVTVQKTASALLLDGVSIVLQTVVGMAVLAFYHPFLLGFDLLLLVSIAFAIFALGRGSVATAIKESKCKYAVAAWLEELARHTTAFKIHAGKQFALERADQLAGNWLDARRKHFKIVIRQILFALGLQAVAATVLLGLGGWLVIVGELTLGQLVAAELIVMMIVRSFAKMGKHMEGFYDLLASVDKLGALFDLAVESQDRLFHVGKSGPAAVKLASVTYKFGSQAAISDLSLEFAPGVSVAIVGRAGSGKSTLADLICGLRIPTSGHIEFDGFDLRELRPDSLREHLAVAGAKEIFNGSIDENVHMNRSNLKVNDVRASLEFVGLLNDVLELPDGLNSVLQTDGAPLTGSQSQRLMLARAIVGRPRLLVIDGTLDGLPDSDIGELMARLTDQSSPWTLLIVTARDDIMRACDRVVQL